LLLAGTVQLTAVAHDATGNVVPRPAEWSSSASHVAAVSGSGLVSGLAFGSATISAVVGGVTGTQALAVTGIQSGSGTAIIDGAISANEWTRATIVNVALKIPGQTTAAKLYVMNDATNLYFAFAFERTPPAGERNIMSFEFDDDISGHLSPGDDGFVVVDGVFTDSVRSTAPPCPTGVLCRFFDTALGGTEDGSGAFTNDGNNQTYEFLHPLKSGDAHDFSLDHGARIGMRLLVRLQQADGTLQDTTLPNNADGFIKL
jgi:hypothetical protein